MRARWFKVKALGVLGLGVVALTLFRSAEPPDPDDPVEGGEPSAGVVCVPGRNPDAARALYLLLKNEGVQHLPLVALEKWLFHGAKDVTFQDLCDRVACLGGRAEARRESLEPFLDRGKPGILLVRSPETTKQQPGCGRFLFCPGRLPGGRGVRVVDPRLGVKTLTESGLAAWYLGASLVLETPLPPSPDGGPDLVVEEIAWNFGEVVKGGRISHIFHLRNGGTAPLTIRSIETTCGCAAGLLTGVGGGGTPQEIAYPDPILTAARKDREILRGSAVRLHAIPPGGAADLLLVFDTNHKGDDQKVVATLGSNDPDEPVLKLHMEGKVVRRFVIEPLTLFLGRVSPHARKETCLRVRSANGKDFSLTELRTTSGHVEAVLEGKGSRPVHTIRVLLKAGAPFGPFSCHVGFRADGFPMAVVVAALIKGTVEARPDHFSFGRVLRGESAESRVVVSGPQGPGFRVLAVEVDHPHMQVGWKMVEPGKIRLTLVLEKGWTTPRIEAVVRVRTTDLIQPELKVRAFGFVQRSR